MMNAKRALWIAATVAVLVGCGGSGGGGGANVADVALSGSGRVFEIRNDGPVNVTYTGSGSTLNFHGVDVRLLTLSGSNNLFYFGPGTTVGECQLVGDDNTFQAPAALAFDCDGTGAGNQLIRY